jgi:membrane peptidoglycan carboxypeptidase
MTTTSSRPGASGTTTTVQRGGRRGKRPAKARRPLWKRLLIWTLAALGVLLALGLAAFAVLYFTTDVPEPNDFATAETSIVYAADGQTELGRFSTENRVSVPLEQVPEHVRYAFLAAEDRTFYSNQGVSVTGIGRAVWNNLRGGDTQGGSTITQQYVKNYYLTQDQTVERKVREIMLAIKIDNTLSKDQILEDYLNTVYFGRGAYGIETASQAWFRTDVANLTVAQGAVLASVLQAPSAYDPVNGEAATAALTERFTYVVEGMVAEGWLTAEEAAVTTMPEIAPPPSDNALGGTNGYLLSMVRSELLANGFSEQQVDSGGLRVQSTFDVQAQNAAVQAVQQEFPTEDAADVHVGLASVEPGTGAVRAVYGGADYVARPLNDATQAFIPGGSTFKAFTLGALLEDDISLDSRFAGNSPFRIPGDTNPETMFVNNEFDQDYGQSVTMWKATEDSINTAFVDATVTVGPAAVKDVAMRLGIPETQPNGQSTELLDNARITLGTASVNALEMANAYAVYAAQGTYAAPFTVASVRSIGGELLYESAVEPRQVIAADVAADVTAALQRVVTDGTGTEARALDRPAAGKTGTAGPDGDTQSSWFVGYTPQLATAVGFYRGEGRVTDDLDGAGGLSTFFGGAYPARTWTAFMIGALEGKPVVDFPPAANVGSATRSNQAEDDAPAPAPTAAPQPTVAPQPTTAPQPTQQPQPTTEPQPTPQPTAVPQPTTAPAPPGGNSQGGGNGQPGAG